MNTTDLMMRWSVLSVEEIERELQAGTSQEAVEQLFGAEEAAAMREVAQTRSVRGRREAVVLLPGFMGSLLSSIRGITSLLWINPSLFINGQSRYLELNADGTGDGSPIIHSVPSGLEKVSYLKAALTLRKECLLFEFPYDWRRPIESNGDLLAQAIERWADDDPGMQFTLVGHSMGGLVSRAYLLRHREQAQRRIKRLIMHGTPHFGAAGAVADLMYGNSITALATKLNGDNDVRRLMVNLPSGYQLLPAPRDLFPAGRSYPVDFDVYDAREWRTAGMRQDYLDAGRRFHELLADFDHPVETIEIAGCHVDTVVEVRRSFDAGDRPQLEIVRQDKGPDSGDATVPLWSARLPGATMYYVEQVHRYLPRNDDVLQATVDLVYGHTPSLPTELPKPKGGLLGLFRATGSPEQLAERLAADVANGTLSAEDLELMYFFSS